MFIGATGAGKSYAAQELLVAEGLDVVVVNDASDKVWPQKFRRISWGEVLKATNCNVLVEDLINVTDKEVAVLKLLLNYNAHHKVLPTVIFIAHSSNGTGAYTILQNMSHFCFMLLRSSATSLSSVLRVFEFGKPEIRAKKNAFLSALESSAQGYWVLEPDTGKFEPSPGSLARSGGGAGGGGVVSARGGGREQALTLYKKTAQKFLALFCPETTARALAIFDYVMDKVPLHNLSPDDLNFTLREKKSGTVVRVSLLDYLHTVTTQVKPSRAVLDLHAYFARYVTLPRLVVANAHPKFLS